MKDQNGNNLRECLYSEQHLREMHIRETGYRKGANQALWFAADIVNECASLQQVRRIMAFLANESLCMRYDRRGGPFYIDELQKRLKSEQDHVDNVEAEA